MARSPSSSGWSTSTTRRPASTRGARPGCAARSWRRAGASASIATSASRSARTPGSALAKLDNHLCELKELQIRDGLHELGTAPAGDQLTDLLVALVRVPRGHRDGRRCLAAARARGRSRARRLRSAGRGDGGALAGRAARASCRTSTSSPGAAPATPSSAWSCWRGRWSAGRRAPAPDWPATRGGARRDRDDAAAGGAGERARPRPRAVLQALDGRFVEPGPSGAPTRGRADVLPTGRNFYSVDSRAVPTPAAWHLGWRSAALLIERYVQEQGEWPRAVALSAWGTANMRTGGDDIAQALALIGARPVWDGASHRVTGTEILPPDLLDRPRVDVTLRVSGFFRDAFPAQIELFDQAVRAIAALDEPAELNPIAARVRQDEAALIAQGAAPEEARRRAGHRVFGSKPGAYGAGLQALIDERGWQNEADLARAYLAWGGYAYGGGTEGAAEHAAVRAPPRRGRAGAAQPGQPRARHPRQRRLLPVRGRPHRGRAPPLGRAARGLPQRPLAPRDAAHRHAEGGDRAHRAGARGQPQVARGRDAPRLQGRLRDRRDGRLPVRLRRDRAAWSRTTISTRSTTPTSPTTEVRDFIADGQPGRARARSPSASRKPSSAASGAPPATASTGGSTI